MLGVYRQRRALLRGHGVSALSRGSEDRQYGGHGADGTEDNEVLPDARQHEGLFGAVGRRALSAAAVELHMREQRNGSSDVGGALADARLASEAPAHDAGAEVRQIRSHRAVAARRRQEKPRESRVHGADVLSGSAEDGRRRTRVSSPGNCRFLLSRKIFSAHPEK